MRRLILIMLMLSFLPISAHAVDFTAPEAPAEAQEYMPDKSQTFSEGLCFIIKKALEKTQPVLVQTAGTCLSVICIIILCSILQAFSGESKRVVNLVGTVIIGVMLFGSTDGLIGLGAQTVVDMSDYGNLLLPVMTGALAAQGGIGASTALYAGTALFSAVLNKAISALIIPLLYVYTAVSICCCAISQPLLDELKKFLKWLITWLLKIVLYVFIGYMGITGVVSGTADASAVKATKLTISGMIPVVGGIISDASETILVSAGLVKNSVGIYGLLVYISLLIGPFLQIGIPYLLFKMTGSVCMMFGVKEPSKLISEFSTVMGMILGMTGTVALLLMVSTVCFMKGLS